MDYRKFLDKREELVLPYFGGTRVDAKDRHYRIVGDWQPGWWRLAIKKREARPARPAEPEAIDHLPAVRGHYAGGWLFSSGRGIHRIALPSENEPDPFAPCIGRRWYGGEILMDTIEFEDDAETAARMALEEGESISGIKGISPGLRAAFGYAVAMAAAAEKSTHLSAREVASSVIEIAEGGKAVALEIIDRILVQRARQDRLNQERMRERRLTEAARSAVVQSSSVDPIARADHALQAAGARMLRAQGRNRMLEVVFRYMGERFIATVDRQTLRVIDSGICLSGADRDLNLKSLPSAIKEAIETGALHITRH